MSYESTGILFGNHGLFEGRINWKMIAVTWAWRVLSLPYRFLNQRCYLCFFGSRKLLHCEGYGPQCAFV